MITTTTLRTPTTWLKPAIAAALLAWIYHPTFVWMIDRWSARDSYFAHGFLIPAVSLYWIWRERKQLAALPQEGSPWGIPVLLLAAVIQIFASVFRIYFISAFSFVILLFGAVLALYGTQVVRRIWYPLLFLLLMVPLPLLVISEITLEMKFIVTELAVHVLNFVGIDSYRNGSYIVLPNAFLLVGDPCSGLRSFLAFLCLGFVFAHGSHLKPWAKVVLIGAGLPLAVFSNLLRVFGLGLIAEIYGQNAAGGKVHDASGFVVFAIAFAIFMLVRSRMEASHACVR